MEKTEKFIKKVINIHKKKYDYSLVTYINNKTLVKIICKEHGIFEQRPDSHIMGKGCPMCSKSNKLTQEEFISKAKLKHGNKYNYSLVNYLGSKIKIKIICPEHGEFEQQPCEHIIGHGCRNCSNDKIRKSKIFFINESNILHNKKYNYSLVDYENSSKKIKIICPEHGEFEQTPNNHLSKKQGCPKCSLKYNKSENELKDFIKLLGIDIIENSRNIISPLELDIFIPSKKLAIEYNGLHWHSELYKDDNYHLNKTQECEKQGIQVIHIFEDEWLDKKDIVKSRLMNILGLTPNKIYARKTEIREVSPKDAKQFIDENHLQGNVNAKIKLGLYYNNELVSIMTFGSLRNTLGNKSKEKEYELYRFCNKINTSVIGGADKLLKHFIKTYEPKQIISYADRRWSQGGLYQKLGFQFIHNSPKSFSYIINNKREFRFKYRKDVLIKQGFDPNKTAREIMLNRKLYRIYDCGSKKYLLNFNN